MANTTGTKGSGEHRSQTEQAADKARDVAAQATDKAREAMQTVGEQASRVASSVGQTAEQATQAAGSGLRNLGERLGENAPREGMLGTAAQYAASGLQRSGRYIEEQGLSGMMDDLTEVIRRNPMPAVLIGIGVGFLLGRLLRR
jgi:ElaB/YqjD/DUF883 family membrane-anchored ribosome-binding protein